MENFIKTYWPYLVNTILLTIYKLLRQRSHMSINSKKKKLELIKDIRKSFSKNITEFLDTEKLNIYFGVKFSIEEMKACMNSHNIRTAIKTLKRYYNVIEVDNNRLVPQRMLIPTHCGWTCGSYILIVLLIALSVLGIYISSPSRVNIDNISEFNINLFRYGIFFLFLIFSLRELVNLMEARKFFKIYLKRNKITIKNN